MKSRWIPHILIVSTALICLGIGGYAGQVWWAKRLASELSAPWQNGGDISHHCGDGTYFRTWRTCPQWGMWTTWFYYQSESPADGDFSSDARGMAYDYCWVPRRTYYELLLNTVDADLGNDPDIWEVWFKRHPNLIWDEKRRQLTEGKKS